MGVNKLFNGFKYSIHGNKWTYGGYPLDGGRIVRYMYMFPCELYHQKHMVGMSRKGSDSTLANLFQWQPSNCHDNQNGYYRPRSRGDNTFGSNRVFVCVFIDHEAGEMICLVAFVRPSVCLSTLSHLNHFSTGAEWSILVLGTKGPVKRKSTTLLKTS